MFEISKESVIVDIVLQALVVFACKGGIDTANLFGLKAG